LAEFTGERVVPGEVAPDLWNEHYARYVFASRLARGKRVLDIGCGAGYGSETLSRTALRVVGIDIAPAVVGAARRTYTGENVHYAAASAETLPFADGTFDLIVSFEVIEHLANWPSLLAEARRLLAPGGQFIVSTPNKLYYAESRKESGPNPYHAHEFEYQPFRTALLEQFPHVAMFLQNHVQAIAFQSAVASSNAAQIAIQEASLQPAESHFFLAVCALIPQTGAPTWVYLPSTANLLRERERHIGLLESELAQKNQWLEACRAEHARLVEMFRAQAKELEERAEWAESLNHELAASQARVAQLQLEFATEQQSNRTAVQGYENKITELEAELRARTEALQQIEDRLRAELQVKLDELAHCVELLDKAETTVVERTRWAQELEGRAAHMEGLLNMAAHSRWMRLGRVIGVGPKLGNS